MSSEDFLAAVSVRWLAAVNLVALGLALAGLFTLFAPVQYRSQTELYAVAVNRQITSSDLYNSALMAQARVPVYARLADTPQVLDPVIAELGLQVSSADLARHLSVDYEDDTSVLSIAVLDARPAGAQALADAFGASLTKVVNELEKTGQQSAAVELRVLSEGTFPTVPATPRRPLNVLFGFGAGVVAASAVVLVTAVRHYLQRRRTESRWAYLTIDGEMKLALVQLIESTDGSSGDPQGTLQRVVKPLRGTAPRAVNEELSGADS